MNSAPPLPLFSVLLDVRRKGAPRGSPYALIECKGRAIDWEQAERKAIRAVEKQGLKVRACLGVQEVTTTEKELNHDKTRQDETL